MFCSHESIDGHVDRETSAGYAGYKYTSTVSGQLMAKKLDRDKKLEYTGVVKPILDYLNSLPGSKAIKVHGGIYSERGTPDILGCVKGRTVAFECKRGATEKAEEIQEWRLAEWQAAGAITGRVDTVEQVRKLLSEDE